MDSIPKEQLRERMRMENPWWSKGKRQPHTDKVYRNMRPRLYLDHLVGLVKEDVRRAVVLMGQRRVGKTVLLQQTIQALLKEGVSPRAVAYLSIDQPLYSYLSIEDLAGHAREAGWLAKTTPVFLFLDEIQYLKDWERHLKVFVDTHPNIKCVVSGSAAAALRLKSMESGAGRFTHFFLPSLTFYEYMNLQKIDAQIVWEKNEWKCADINALNDHFIRYINIGGYPEVIFSDIIKRDMERYVRSDIVDKVLLRDLPALYGIQDTQELHKLFMMLAWNTAQEISLDGLSQQSGVSKPTIKRYLEYLEAAFLINIVHRIDHNARRFKRANFFKVYLTNPSIRCALFGALKETAQNMGALTETAVFAQWFNTKTDLYYARWKSGEVDMVFLDRNRQHPFRCIEIKWSDRNIPQWNKRGPFKSFLEKHPDMQFCTFTTRTKTGAMNIAGRKVTYRPASIHCYLVGEGVDAITLFQN